jgi:hypothetical protein
MFRRPTGIIILSGPTPTQKHDSLVRSFSPSLWLPAYRTSVAGTSGNLVTFDSGSPTTGWTGTRATLSAVGGSLKALCNDAGGAGTSFAYQLITNGHLKYAGITALFTAQAAADAGNVLNQDLYLDDGVAGGSSSGVTKDGTYYSKTATRRIATNATAMQARFRAKNAATANTTDFILGNSPVVTVPQILDATLKNYLHPDGPVGIPGIGWRLDGADDLAAAESDLQGTGNLAIMFCGVATGWGPGTPRILDNGKTVLYMEQANARLILSSNAFSNNAYSPNNSIALNQKYCIIATRTSAGVVNFRINGQASGAANQDSGTPAAGTSNTVIGNRIATDRGYAGNIEEVINVPSILPTYAQVAYEQVTKQMGMW